MDYEKFVSIIKRAKTSTIQTGQINVKVATDKEHTLQKIYLEKECRLCKQHVKTAVYVMFEKPVRLSIFQASLLYSLFIENKKPADYASYHKCIAGKEFIDNIKEIRYNNWRIE